MEVALYRISRPFIRLFMYIAYRPKYIGLDNIPKDGRIVLSGNHTNNLDCWLLMSCTKRTIHFLAKDSLVKGWKGIIFKNMGVIPVNRKIHDKNALINAEKALEEDKVIGIFPEGTINREKKEPTLPFKIGSVKMAYDTNTKIVPFVITGKYKFFNNNLKIEFLKPIIIKEDLGKENDRLRSIINKKLEDEYGSIK